jgi:hypothetical protein
MSRWVEDRGHIYPDVFFEPPVNPPKGACPHCGGTGVRTETIDEERYDVVVACEWCRTYCKACDKHVAKTGHDCKGGPER